MQVKEAVAKVLNQQADFADDEMDNFQPRPRGDGFQMTWERGYAFGYQSAIYAVMTLLENEGVVENDETKKNKYRKSGVKA